MSNKNSTQYPNDTIRLDVLRILLYLLGSEYNFCCLLLSATYTGHILKYVTADKKTVTVPLFLTACLHSSLVISITHDVFVSIFLA
jgi:hypothetical protein